MFLDYQHYQRKTLGKAALFSLILHFLLFFTLKIHSNSNTTIPIKVSLIYQPNLTQPPISLPPKQIVTPSKTENEIEPKETNFLSDKNSSVRKEQIKRGKDVLHKANKKSSPSVSRATTSSKPSLKLNDSLLNGQFLKQNVPQNSKEGAIDVSRLTNTEPFSHASTLSLGSSDFLPNIPDGDITMLNAKADRYAVFVRRVASQVFGALRRLSWQELSKVEIQRLRDFSTVEAVMSKEGKLLSLNISNSSGSSYFDGIVKEASNKGCWDQNPPQDAIAVDGNIHFIFKAKTWSRMSPNGISEQRWLLLGTGLL